MHLVDNHQPEPVWSFQCPESTMLVGADYDPTTETLTVQFRSTGKSYTTRGFPQTLWDEFLTADSKGNYFNRHIRPMYLMHPKD